MSKKKCTIESILLKDKTLGRNISWKMGHPITLEDLPDIKPRYQKTVEEQQVRTKGKAEVFTPSWICNEMNNNLDDDWFGAKNVFNTPKGKTWVPTKKVIFPEGKSWQNYISRRVLEITCGEGAFLVSTYDTVTGEIIPLPSRIGIIDRKLRVISENTDSKEEWLKWAIKAYETTYGYEYQGDSLYICRKFMYTSFIDYYKAKFGEEPSAEDLKMIANIISWNIFQMDGLRYIIPYTNEYATLKNWDKNRTERFIDIILEAGDLKAS